MDLRDCSPHQVFQAITMPSSKDPGSSELLSFTAWLRRQRDYKTMTSLTTVSKGGVILSCAIRFSDCAPERVSLNDSYWRNLFRSYSIYCYERELHSGFDRLQSLS